MNTMIKPRVSLVGAGPGDPELMTVKGLKALQKADVVLYDALVNPEILEEAPANALKVYVGKRAAKHRYSQEEINRLIVDYAFQYGHVVRLKGGDPFVFGRGHEELQYVRSFDINIEVIPGISSSIALAELEQVPLTCRGINESFWVMTGTTRSGQLSADVHLAAQSKATAVILMGMRKIQEITKLFAENGKGATPVMVIQNGSLPNQQVALGTVDTIVAKVRQQEMGTPGIIVIGEVVNLHPELCYTYAQQQQKRA